MLPQGHKVLIATPASKNSRFQMGKQTAIFCYTSTIYQGVSDPCHQLMVKSSLETDRIPAILAPQHRAQPAIWPAADWNCGHAKSSTGNALRRCGAAGVVPQASSNCSSAKVFRKTSWPDRLGQKTMPDTSLHHGDHSGKTKHWDFASTVPLRLHQAQWIDSRAKMRGNCGM